MDNARLAQWWLLLVGGVLIVVGIVGFLPNPLVGPSGLVATDNVHNVIHVATGLLALALAIGWRSDIGAAAMLFGALYGAVFVLTLISPNLFGILPVPVNVVDHVIHVGVAFVSLALGYLARGRSSYAAA
jgi:hypothetical protein